ncbi:MAG: phosphopantothenoylcysteine decarboxylase [Spirochaetaceae bacterium]|jgi:phosphopantothenoylcysteine decarboxylase/phosphopantothenoylcysteine decarboxylase/phosphopantothenate--cysteine ligase|nr:phosphopantothenoylcysteine decarboxylase [Spirochaetaceae bacterium]
MKTIILGITGSIAAYKAAEVANALTKEGIGVEVIMTAGARRFITPLTLQILSKRKVHVDMFEEYIPDEVRHISLAKKADLALVAPATANIIGKLASGIADDMLSTTLLALRGKPILICPAMNTAMYENPAVQDNIARLKGRGCLFVEPREALLACGDLGKGALADVEHILEAVRGLDKSPCLCYATLT